MSAMAMSEAVQLASKAVQDANEFLVTQTNILTVAGYPNISLEDYLLSVSKVKTHSDSYILFSFDYRGDYPMLVLGFPRSFSLQYHINEQYWEAMPQGHRQSVGDHPLEVKANTKTPPGSFY
jgi:hypothetical protein